MENTNENINSDFLSHQFKLKKVNSDITEKVKKIEADKKKLVLNISKYLKLSVIFITIIF